MGRGVGVRLVQHGQIVPVTVGDIGGQIGGEGQGAALARTCPAQKRDAKGCQTPEIHRLPAVSAGHGNGHMFGSGGRGGHVPFAKAAQPPAEILPPIAAGRAVVGADRQKDAATGAHEFLGDLRAG